METGITYKDLKEQEVLALQIIELSSKSKKLIQQITNTKTELSKKIEEKGESKRLLKKLELLKSLEDKLKMFEGRYQMPQLNDQINFLIRSVNAADQKPSKNMYVQFKKLKTKLEILKNEFESEAF